MPDSVASLLDVLVVRARNRGASNAGSGSFKNRHLLCEILATLSLPNFAAAHLTNSRLSVALVLKDVPTTSAIVYFVAVPLNLAPFASPSLACRYASELRF